MEKCVRCGRPISIMNQNHYLAVNDYYYMCEECGDDNLEESQYGWYDRNEQSEVDNYNDDELSDVEFWKFIDWSK